MSNDEQMAILGRMVTERKELRAKEATLADEVRNVCKELTNLLGLLHNYEAGPYYSQPLTVSPAMAGLVNTEKITKLVDDLLSVRQELSNLSIRLRQAGVE